MSTTGRAALPWLIVAQLIVTLSLLGFAYAVQDRAMQSLIVGAAIAHWLSESNKLGRQVADERMAQIIGNSSDAVTTAVVQTTASTPPES